MHARKLVTAASLAGVGLLGLTGTASAHISPSPDTAPAGSYFKFDLQVPHGCGDAGTSKLEVQIPEGITSVTPQVVAGWTIARTTEPVSPPIDDGEGGQITERTALVTWTGGPLAHDQLEEFGLSVKLPDTPGETLAFPVIQTCEDGSATDWIQRTEPGGEEPEHPAPTITLTEPTGDGHGDTEGEEAPDDSEEPADVSADDDDGDDATGIAVAGVVLGVLGIGVGGIALARGRRSA
jgi:uncharacterized protein YcnI